jgi:hypothetical protein
MGFFKDIHTVTKQAKEIERNQPPVKDRMADASARMAEANQFMQAQAAATTAATSAMVNGDPGTAQVVSVQQTAANINFEPVLNIELLVMQAGRPPRPVTIQTPVPQVCLPRVQPGASLSVNVDRTNAANVVIVWDRAPA